MRKIAFLGLCILLSAFVLISCQQATSDTWTDLTAANIAAEIAKYDGKFKNSEGNRYLLFFASEKKNGSGNSADAADNYTAGAAEIINELQNAGTKIQGNGGSQIKMIGGGKEVILTRYE